MIPGLIRERPLMGLRGPQFCSHLAVVNRPAIDFHDNKLTSCLEGMSDLADSLDEAPGVVGRRPVARN